jgi:hypothetical protein
MLIHLPIVILASLYSIPVVDTVPKFDIARECRSEGGPPPVQQRCASDEAQARDQLQKEWVQFAPSAKVQCDGEATSDGSASYVEFLTCLEMERDAKAERDPATTNANRWSPRGSGIPLDRRIGGTAR